MSEEQTTGEEVPVGALLAEITAIDAHIIPLAVERMRSRLLQAELDRLKGDADGEP